jgi:hypothetical protein
MSNNEYRTAEVKTEHPELRNSAFIIRYSAVQRLVTFLATPPGLYEFVSGANFITPERQSFFEFRRYRRPLTIVD